MKKLFAAIAASIAGYYVSKFIMEKLEERPLLDRMDDLKSKASDLKASAYEKASGVSAQGRAKYGEVLSKLDELYQGKKDSE